MLAPARFRLTGCALLAVAFLAGCGGGSASTGTTDATITDGRTRAPTETTTTPAKPASRRARQQAKSPGGPCQAQLGSFVASMDSLRRRLAVGVTYDQYVAEVKGIRSTYGKIPIDQVEIGCLGAVGTPGERAFNRYVEAADDWGECVSEAGCSSATVEPVLQRRWRIASHFLSEADESLEASAP
ncbi:MAG TPA: hypothetical protein VFL77_08290 [Solirubrobacterales bacterium]|nr:hypothetical protein [Solirubrobacterales bacterium]